MVGKFNLVPSHGKPHPTRVPQRTKSDCLATGCMESERARRAEPRQRLFDSLRAAVPEIVLNGPQLSRADWRLPGNLN